MISKINSDIYPLVSLSLFFEYLVCAKVDIFTKRSISIQKYSVLALLTLQLSSSPTTALIDEGKNSQNLLEIDLIFLF